MNDLSCAPLMPAALQSIRMLRRPDAKLSAVAAVAAFVMATSPAPAFADPLPSDGDMYQPWVPGQPKPTPKPGQDKPAGNPGDPGSATTDTVVVVGAAPLTGSESKVAGTARLGSGRTIAVLPASRLSLEVAPATTPGPSRAPLFATLALAFLGCAWLLRPRRS